MSKPKIKGEKKARRIFVGIPASGEVRACVHGIRKQVHGGVYWMPAKNMHMTVLFFGNVSDEELSLITRATEAVAEEVASFVLSFEKIVCIPEEKSPRMLWMQFARNHIFRHMVAALAGQTAVFPTAQFVKEHIPHITIARFKKGAVHMVPPIITGVDFSATELVVYESVENSSSKRLYMPLDCFLLRH